MEHRWLKEVHLKLKLGLNNGQFVDAIAFNARDKFQFDATKNKVRVVYELDKNEFNGRVNLQLRMLHVEN